MSARRRTARSAPAELQQRAASLLKAEWTRILDEPTESETRSDLPASVADAIRLLIESRTISYRYVPLTQLLAKAVDPTKDARSLQKEFRGPGAFDARSLCSKVVCPFDRVNDRVLGGSPDPYVNNPLRNPAATRGAIRDKRDKAGWRAICLLLEWIESNPHRTLDCLRFCLRTIKTRLVSVRVTYPIPNRISLEASTTLLSSFLGARTGGRRLQLLAAALLSTWGLRFAIFRGVRHAKITAADASTGQVADIECTGENDEILLAVEVKDQQLVVRHLEEKLPGLRRRRIREVLFLASKETAQTARGALAERTSREFAAGMNIYTFEFMPFSRVVLAMLGEDGRRQFLERVGELLDSDGTIKDRQDWRNRLEDTRAG